MPTNTCESRARAGPQNHVPNPLARHSATTRALTRRAVLRSEAGLTLIEVLVTAVIVVLLASATATALISTTHASGDQRYRSQADAIASQDQERLRGLSDAQLNGLDQTRSETVGATDFSVTSTAIYLDTTGANSCTSSAVAYYKTTSTVTWGENYKSQPNASLSVESVLGRPVGGGLLVQVKGQTGQWLSGVSVGAVGPDTQNGTTDSNGCLLFAGLTPGGYTATLSRPGFVDQDGVGAPTATATVTGTGVQSPSSLPIYMGPAGSIVGSFTTSTAGVGGEADGISWSGSGTTPAAMSTGFGTAPSSAPSPSATTLTTGSLFPFYRSVGTVGYTNNYVVWGGRCAGQQPPSGYTPASVNPGQTGQAVNVREPLLDVGSVRPGLLGAPVRPAHVKLAFTSTGCTDTWLPAITTAATMPTTGWLTNPGQPYAATNTLSVCADYNSGGTYYMGSVTTGNTLLAPNSVNPVPPITMAVVPSGTVC